MRGTPEAQRHQHVTRVDKLEKQVATAGKDLQGLDNKWQEFVCPIRAKFNQAKGGLHLPGRGKEPVH